MTFKLDLHYSLFDFSLYTVPSFTLSSSLVNEGGMVQACVTLQTEPTVEMLIHISTRDSTDGAAVGKVV